MIRLQRFWRRRFLEIELTLAVIITITVAVAILIFAPDGDIPGITKEDRSLVYRTTASVAAALLGFLITVVSVILGFAHSDQLSVLRKSRHYLTLWHVFFNAIQVLAFLVLASFAGLLLDLKDSPRLWVEMIFLFLATLAIFRVARSIWVLRQIILIVANAMTGQK